VLEGEERGAGAGAHSDLPVDVDEVGVHGGVGNVQGRRDLLVGLCAGEQPEDLDLAVGQPRRPGPARAAGLRPMPGGGEHGLPRPPVELAVRNLAPEFGSGGGGLERGPPGAFFDHRLVDLGGDQQARSQGQRSRREATVIAGAIDPLVVQPGDLAAGAQRRADGQDALGVVGVELDPRPFRRVEWPALAPDQLGDADVAQVVDLGRPAERGNLGRGQAQLSRGAIHQARELRRVPAGVRRLEVDEVGEGPAYLVQV